MTRYRRILVTGAAGKLGSQLRKGLKPCCDIMRLTDIADLGEAAPNEEIAYCDLADETAIFDLCQDVDAIVHFGGYINEAPFDTVLKANIIGGYHVYEGARRAGVKRVVYASSIHAVGFYPREQIIDSAVMHRPDSLYGVSKCFTEDLARMYYDKYGIESACLRICSSVPEPVTRRMLGTWLSFDDCVQLVERALMTSRIGYTVAYGISNNREHSVSNHMVEHLGYQPRHTAEQFRHQIESSTPPEDPRHPNGVFVGGYFTTLNHFDLPS